LHQSQSYINLNLERESNINNQDYLMMWLILSFQLATYQTVRGELESI